MMSSNKSSGSPCYTLVSSYYSTLFSQTLRAFSTLRRYAMALKWLLRSRKRVIIALPTLVHNLQI